MESRLNMAPEWRTEQHCCKITTGSPVIAIEFEELDEVCYVNNERKEVVPWIYSPSVRNDRRFFCVNIESGVS